MGIGSLICITFDISPCGHRFGGSAQVKKACGLVHSVCVNSLRKAYSVKSKYSGLLARFFFIEAVFQRLQNEILDLFHPQAVSKG